LVYFEQIIIQAAMCSKLQVGVAQRSLAKLYSPHVAMVTECSLGRDYCGATVAAM